MIERFFGALQFLTVLPVRGSTCSPGRAAMFFPLVGAGLGLLAASLQTMPLLAVGALVLATGGLHEDGLADCADAFRAGRSRERILQILKDSRIGVYGALALIFSVAIRWQSLSLASFGGIVAAVALSRSALVLLAAAAPPVGAGLGAAFGAQLTRPVVWLVGGQALLFAALAGWPRGLCLAAADALVIWLSRVYFVRRIGGVTGDCLGATSQIVEMVNLAILAWRPSF